MTKTEYYVSEVAPGKFTVAKFQDGEPLPTVVYNVTYNHETGKGRCDCPAALYRGTGSADKHVLMVRDWVLTGKLLPKLFGEGC